MFGQKNRDASIPVVVPIIVSIVMVPMMVAVPPLPPIFIGVTVVAVAVVAVVVRSVWLVSGANVDAKPIVCFGLGWVPSRSARTPPNLRGNIFHMILFLNWTDWKDISLLLLALDQAPP